MSYTVGVQNPRGSRKREGMNNSSYKGDSPGKKVTRLRLWLHIRTLCRALNLPYVGTLVLAGEGGDLSVLKGMGTDLSTVVAIDYDSFLIEWCNELYPDVIAMVGEAGEMSEVADYNIAHLDFCGGLRQPENIVTLAKVVQNAQTHPAMIALTMQKCREGTAVRPLVENIPRAVQEALLAEAIKRKDPVGTHIFRGNRFDARLVLKQSNARMRSMLPISPQTIARHFYRRDGALGDLGHAMVRADAMRWCAEWLLAGWNFQKGSDPVVLRLVGAYTYQSDTRYKKGQPYLTALYAAMPVAQEAAVMASLKGVGIQRFDAWDQKTSLSGLRTTALDMIKHIPEVQVAQMLDIDKVRISNWQEEGSPAPTPLFAVENLLEFPWRGFAYKKHG